jgi:hypothetical protein
MKKCINENQKFNRECAFYINVVFFKFGVEVCVGESIEIAPLV